MKVGTFNENLAQGLVKESRFEIQGGWRHSENKHGASRVQKPEAWERKLTSGLMLY